MVSGHQSPHWQKLPGETSRKKGKRRGRRHHGCCHRRVKVKKGERRCRALEQCLKRRVDAVPGTPWFYVLSGPAPPCWLRVRQQEAAGDGYDARIFQDFDWSSTRVTKQNTVACHSRTWVYVSEVEFSALVSLCGLGVVVVDVDLIC